MGSRPRRDRRGRERDRARPHRQERALAARARGHRACDQDEPGALLGVVRLRPPLFRPYALIIPLGASPGSTASTRSSRSTPTGPPSSGSWTSLRRTISRATRCGACAPHPLLEVARAPLTLAGWPAPEQAPPPALPHAPLARPPARRDRVHPHRPPARHEKLPHVGVPPLDVCAL